MAGLVAGLVSRIQADPFQLTTWVGAPAVGSSSQSMSASPRSFPNSATARSTAATGAGLGIETRRPALAGTTQRSSASTSPGLTLPWPDHAGDGTAQALGGSDLDGHGRLADGLEAALGEKTDGGAAAQMDVGAFDRIHHHGETAAGARRLAQDGLRESRRAAHGGLLDGAVRAQSSHGAGENAVHRFGGVAQRLGQCPGERAVRAVFGLHLAGFLVGLGGGQCEHAEHFGIDGLVGSGIEVGGIVGHRLMQRRRRECRRACRCWCALCRSEFQAPRASEPLWQLSAIKVTMTPLRAALKRMREISLSRMSGTLRQLSAGTRV